MEADKVQNELTVLDMVQCIDDTYPNHSVEAGKRRGLAVILSMEENRRGGAVDRGRLEVLFKVLGFDNQIVVNDSVDVKAYLRQLVQLPHLAQDDCLLFSINAHGGIEDDGREYIFLGGAGKEPEKLYVVDDILKPITECSYLANKPKVFLFNACRGTGKLVPSKKAEGSEVQWRVGQVQPDCLVVFSTSHGELSFRDPNTGTIFVRALMDAFVEGFQLAHGHADADVSSIAMKTLKKVSEREDRQSPQLSSTFIRKLYWSVAIRKSTSSFSGGTPSRQLYWPVYPNHGVEASQRRGWQRDGTYPNHSVEKGERRGLAIIVSMGMDRCGEAEHIGRLDAIFRILGFDTEVVVDDCKHIETCLKQLAMIRDLEEDDCFLFWINAQGGIDDDGRQYIILGSGAGKELKKLYVGQDIVNPICECEYLANKPKLFLLNITPVTGSLGTSSKAKGSDVGESQVVRNRFLHYVKDCLVVYSMSHGGLSFSDPENGTNFSMAFMKTILDGSLNEDVLNIISGVIRAIDRHMEHQSGPGNCYKRFQRHVYTSSLTKRLYWS